MSRPKTRFNGDKLLLPDWNFGHIDSRVPHRRHTLAEHRDGPIRYVVSANHKKTLFWVHAVGPGFAGDNSRRSHTVTTRSESLARLWIQAVQAGKVGIE